MSLECLHSNIEITEPLWSVITNASPYLAEVLKDLGVTRVTINYSPETYRTQLIYQGVTGDEATAKLRELFPKCQDSFDRMVGGEKGAMSLITGKIDVTPDGATVS